MVGQHRTFSNQPHDHQVRSIAAHARPGPLILQNHEPQIRLLLVITLLRNNRHICMQARELWLVVQIFATPKASLSVVLAHSSPVHNPGLHVTDRPHVPSTQHGVFQQCHPTPCWDFALSATSTDQHHHPGPAGYGFWSNACEYAPGSWLCRGQAPWFAQACEVGLPGP